MSKSNYTTLESILSKDAAELAVLKEGEFEAEKLGVIPFTALENPEFKQAKKDCIKLVPGPEGGARVPEVDDDKLMLKVVVAAVDKDKRSNFTFANKDLLQKLGVVSAEQVVEKLLSPGEIQRFAVAVQEVSGFGPKAQKAREEAVKNS